MAETLTADPAQVTTGPARLSYLHIVQPYDRKDGNPPKYSATLLIPKNDKRTKEKLDAAIEHVAQKASGMLWGGRPPIFAAPIHDGDGTRPSDGRPFGEECKGHWVFTASSLERPSVVDIHCNEILNTREIYSGMYGRASVRFFPYNRNGKKGVGCALNHLQKLDDGEPLSGRVSPEEAFAEIPQGYVPPYPTSSGAARPAPLAADPMFA